MPCAREKETLTLRTQFRIQSPNKYRTIVAMDDVELAIHDAWQRVRPILLADEAELARRLARRRNAGLGRPPRACVYGGAGE